MNILDNQLGLIGNKLHSWYDHPDLYERFSQAEDPENICLNFLYEQVKHNEIKNPVDLATGTGRVVRGLLPRLNFKGLFYCIDSNKKMCEFAMQKITEFGALADKVKIQQQDIENLPQTLGVKSNLVISFFGFPSKITDHDLCLKELRAVYEILEEKGELYTVGWDEKFDDELNSMWYMFVDEGIKATNFADWSKEKSKLIVSPRNCNLKWLDNLHTKLRFKSVEESSEIMAKLFGESARQYVLENLKTEWKMSLGVTYNTKEELREILEKYE